MGQNGETIYFAHIGKTAGTSVRKAAYKAFGVDRCVCVYGRGMSGNTPGADDVYYDALEAGGEDAAAAAVFAHIENRKARFFSTHHNALFGPRFDPARTFTFVRDPVARTVSNFNFWMAQGLWDDDFEAFIADKRMTNPQAKTFVHLKLRRLGAIGIVERFDESIDLINRIFGFEFSKRRENKTGWRPFRPWYVDIKTLDPALRRQIEDANTRDMGLYDRALTRFETLLSASA